MTVSVINEAILVEHPWVSVPSRGAKESSAPHCCAAGLTQGQAK